jgi:hypothetical protein
MALPAKLQSSRLAIVFSLGKSSGDQLAFTLSRPLKPVITKVGKTEFVAVSFTESQFERAFAILKAVASKKTTQVFNEGKLESSPAKVLKVLECYITSLKSKNQDRYCRQSFAIEERKSSVSLTISVLKRRGAFAIPDANIARKGDHRLETPCRLVHNLVSFRATSKEHAAELSESEAIKTRCEICPNYK